MPEIEIDKKPKIFDDPEYCDDDFEDTCPQITMKNRCKLFGNDFSLFEKRVKHDQCKVEWKKAQNSIIKCKTCGGELGFNGSHYYHTNTQPSHSAIPDKPLPGGHRLG